MVTICIAKALRRIHSVQHYKQYDSYHFTMLVYIAFACKWEVRSDDEWLRWCSNTARSEIPSTSLRCFISYKHDLANHTISPIKTLFYSSTGLVVLSVRTHCNLCYPFRYLVQLYMLTRILCVITEQRQQHVYKDTVLVCFMMLTDYRKKASHKQIYCVFTCTLYCTKCNDHYHLRI